MSSDIKLVNVGTVANDGTGDAMRSAFQQVNSNFSNVDSRISTGNFGVVYSGTYIQANLTLTSKGITTTETLEVNQTANIAGNTRIANLSVNNAFVSSTITSTGNTYVQDSLNVTNNAAITKNLVVGGNLTVLGNTVNIGSADLTINDSLINLHTDVSLAPLTLDDGKDIGIQFHYYKTSDKHAALVWANDSQSLEFYADGTETVGNTFTGTYGNVKIGSLFINNTTATTSTTTGAIISKGGIASAGNIAATNFLGNLYSTKANVGNLSVSGYVVGSMNFVGADTIYINGSAVATSAASFAGGVVPGYSLFNAVLETRGNLFANSQVASTSTITGALVVNGGAGISGTVNAGSVQASAIGSVSPGTGAFTTLTSGNLSLTNGIDSSGITTGALVVAGGIGMSGNLYVGGSINNTSIGVYGAGVGNFTTMNATNLATVTTIKAGGNIVAGSGTASGSVSTGALVVVGGLGVSGTVNASTVTATTLNGTFSGTASITSGSVSGITGSATTFTATNFSSGNIVGVLTGTASTANVALYQSVNASSTNATYYLEFSDRATTGNAASYVTSGITVNPNTNTISATNLSGTLQTAAQTNITSVGTLTGLTVSGAIVPSANATVNLGSPTQWFNNIYGVSSQAKYADLAENYLCDISPAPDVGTVLVFGGEQEVTTTDVESDTRVAGVISGNPAYLMNADLYQGVTIALRGRVPVNVIGQVKKGDLLVTSSVPGYAVSAGNDKTQGAAVFAKSLNDKDDTDPGQVEAVIL